MSRLEPPCLECGRLHPCPCDHEARRAAWLIVVACVLILAALIFEAVRG